MCQKCRETIEIDEKTRRLLMGDASAYEPTELDKEISKAFGWLHPDVKRKMWEEIQEERRSRP